MGGGVHSWIIVCTDSSQGSDMLEVLSALHRGCNAGEKPREAWKACFHHVIKSLWRTILLLLSASVPSFSVL